MMHAVMRADHPMLGVDFHIPILPGGPPVPFRTAAMLQWVAGDTKDMKQIDTLPIGFDMTRNTDISTLIPHVGPACASIAVEMVLSGSKSYFGSYQYLHRDPTGASKPVCAALIGPINLNVNCGTPLCTPTGVVLAPNTHVVGFTWWDLAAGAINAALDIAIAFAINKFGGKLLDKVGARLASIAGRIRGAISPYLQRTLGPLLAKQGLAPIRDMVRRLPMNQWAQALKRFDHLPGIGRDAAMSYFGGSPIGYDSASSGGQTLYNLLSGGESPVDMAQAVPERISKFAEDLFGGPKIEQFQ